MSDEYYVEIVQRGTLKVEKRMGPFDERNALMVNAGASRNLNWQNYFVRVVEPKKARRKNTRQETVRRQNGSKKRSRNRRWDGQLTARRKRKLTDTIDLPE